MHKQHFSGIMQKPQKHMFFGALTFGNRTGDPCVLATHPGPDGGSVCVFLMFFLCFCYVLGSRPSPAQPGQPAGQLPGSCRAAPGQDHTGKRPILATLAIGHTGIESDDKPNRRKTQRICTRNFDIAYRIEEIHEKVMFFLYFAF